jgi:chitodextrinase
MSGAKTAYLFLSLSVVSFSQTVAVNYGVDSSWGTGLQASVQITNKGSAPLTNWTFSFDYPHLIGSIWDSTVISRNGTRYTIGPASWNPTIAPGATAYIGWVAVTSGTLTGPTACLVSNQPVTSTTCPSGGGTAPADKTPPSQPTGLRATAQTTNSITLAWNASTDNVGVAGYELMRSGVLAARVTTTSAQITGLAAGTSYPFTVLAYDAAGNKSLASATLNASTLSAPATCSTLPATPTGFAVQTKSSSSVTLGWNASAAQPNCTVSYTLSRGGAAIGTGLTATSYTDSGLQPAASYTYTLVAKNQFGSSQSTAPVVAVTDAAPPPPSPSSGGSWPSAFFAPYVDILLWPTPVLTDISAATGVKRFTLAFIVSGGGCSASWGGVIPLSQQFSLTDVNNLRARGGDVIVSFGGANGIELGQACTSVSALQAQYQAVIDMYGLTRVDFDIEGGAIADTASVDRRNKAIAALQSVARSRGKQLKVQFTLPVLPTGLTWNGVDLLRNAIQNGVDIGLVNIMAMDYGGPSVADPYRMGEAAVAAVNSTFAQMKSLYGTAKTDAQLRALQGVTPMIGLNDVVPEVFTLNVDAPLVTQSATSLQLGMLSMWSLTRDKQCPGTPSVSATCSGVAQSNYAFSLLFNVFQRP